MKTIITRFKNLFLIIISILVFYLFFTNAEYIKINVSSTINYCYKILIPSLFPYMVLSTIVSSYFPINKAFSDFFGKFLKILGICRKYASIIIFGNFSGFITGPKLLSQESELINNKEAYSRMILLSSNAGIGFVISLVGKLLWNSISYGIFLYFIQILLSLMLNSFLIFKKEIGYNQAYTKNNSNSFFFSFANAISSSTSAVISICSYTIVFSLIANLIIKVFSFSKNSVLSSIFLSLIDPTQGVNCAITLENSLLSSFLTGFSIGFGGISIAFQIFSICDASKISKFKYFLSKFVQGSICGVFSSLYVQLFDVKPNNSLMTFSDNSFNQASLIALILFVVLFLIKRYKIRISKKC